MRAYSLDLRERVFADRQAGLPTQQVAWKYRVSPAWVRRLLQRHRETGQITPRSSRNRRIPLALLHADAIRAALTQKPDWTIPELRNQRGLQGSLSGLWDAVKKGGYSLKKKSFAHPNKIVRMGKRNAKTGKTNKRIGKRIDWFLWMKRGPRPR